jgi:hypothetical protein
MGTMPMDAGVMPTSIESHLRYLDIPDIAGSSQYGYPRFIAIDPVDQSTVYRDNLGL